MKFKDQNECDEYWMQQAIQLAHVAKNINEVPVGAVLILDDQLVAEGYNQPLSQQDPTAHAEMVTLRAGAKKIGNYRLINTTLYVTLEPCTMCAGALVHSRIKRLVYGASDPKAGAIVSRAQILDQSFLNHRISHSGGFKAQECGLLLSSFFREKRQKF